MFVNNKRSANAFGARKSKWSDVGILDPGPITNYLLLDENNQPLEGLIRGKHYRGVNKLVWQQLYTVFDAVQSPCEIGRISVFEKIFNKNFM